MDKNKIIVLCDKLPINIKFNIPTKNINKPIMNNNFIGLVENETTPPKEYFKSLIKDHFDLPYNLFRENKEHILC